MCQTLGVDSFSSSEINPDGCVRLSLHSRGSKTGHPLQVTSKPQELGVEWDVACPDLMTLSFSFLFSYFYFLVLHLSLWGNLGCLTWVRLLQPQEQHYPFLTARAIFSSANAWDLERAYRY